MLGLKFDHVRIDFDLDGINSVMTHVLVLSAKVRRNEKLIWQSLDIGNMFGPTPGFKNP